MALMWLFAVIQTSYAAKKKKKSSATFSEWRKQLNEKLNPPINDPIEEYPPFKKEVKKKSKKRKNTNTKQKQVKKRITFEEWRKNLIESLKAKDYIANDPIEEN